MAGDDNFLSRWSRRKSGSRSGAAEDRSVEAVAQRAAPAAGHAVPAPDSAPAAAALPPVETLTPESDFTAFMKPEVDEGLKRKALKALFSDPRFNVMDGLDVYIDDYSKPDPLPESWLAQLNQLARLGNYQEPSQAEVPEPSRAASVEKEEDPAKHGDIAGPAASQSDTPDAGDGTPEVRETAGRGGLPGPPSGVDSAQ